MDPILSTRELIKEYPYKWKALRNNTNLPELLNKISQRFNINSSVFQPLIYNNISSIELAANLHDIYNCISFISALKSPVNVNYTNLYNVLWEIRYELMDEAYKLKENHNDEPEEYNEDEYVKVLENYE